MDVLAHGLWGGAVFGRKQGSSWKRACFWGMFPDLMAFGPAIIAGLITGDRLSWFRWAPEDAHASWITWYSNHAYLVSHSLVVWAVAAGVLSAWQKKFPWAFGAAALHILCDIPLHTLRYFPTPYLWPLPTPLHDGMRWSMPVFMLANYVVLTAIYFYMAIRNRTRPMTIQAETSAGAESRPREAPTILLPLRGSHSLPDEWNSDRDNPD